MRKYLLYFFFSVSGVGQIFGTLIPSTDYYVNGESGSNSNNGTSSTTPFATIAKALSVMTAGKCVSIYGGGTTQIKYREAFTSTGDNQCVVGYGNFQPLLDCSDPISAGAWSKTGGFTNVYQAQITISGDITGWFNEWENGAMLPRAASLANLDSTAGAYFPSADPNAPNGSLTFTMYVHASDNGNPASNGKTYEFNSRGQALAGGSFNQYKLFASNIWARRNLTNNGSVEAGPGSFLTDIRADEGFKHNMLVHEGTGARYLSLNNSYFAGGSKVLLQIFDGIPTGKNVYIQDYTYTETVEQTGQAIYEHDGDSGGLYGDIIVKNMTTIGCPLSVSAISQALSVTFDGGTWSGTAGIAGNGGGLPVNTVKNVTINSPFNSFGLSNFGGNPTVIMRNVTFNTSSASAGNVLVVLSGTAATLDIQNSSFNGPGDGPCGKVQVLGWTSGNPVSMTFKNNTVANLSSGILWSTLSSPGLFDNNVYTNNTCFGNFINYNGAFKTPLQWQALGFDVHSTFN